jgi:hypothetical protein
VDRLRADVARLAAVDQRLAAVEQRLSADEARIEAEEEEISESRVIAWSGIALACALIVAVTALVISVVALEDDVHTIRSFAGKDSVGTLAIRDGAVTTEKLATGSVSRDAVAGEAIGTHQIEPNAVTGALVAPNTLTGADIRESSLGTVPSAKKAKSTGTADDAARLGGAPASAFLSSVVDARAATVVNASSPKGPLTARCPAGSRVISGGARIRGVLRGAAIVTNTPEAGTAWTATARVSGQEGRPWQLVVTAICATGGK